MSSPDPQAAPSIAPRDRIVASLMRLAAQKPFEDITITEICGLAEVTLAQFRESFPSKGAILGAYSRAVDLKVLGHAAADMAAEPAKERLFDVLMRRLDVMAPDKAGIAAVMTWMRRDPLAAAALNQVTMNSMRFMLEAAGIEHEGGLGALKLQGLSIAWTRVLDAWVKDEDAGHAATMAALDRELTRGGQFVARLEDAQRLFEPFHAFARALCDTRQSMGARMRERYRPDAGDEAPANRL